METFTQRLNRLVAEKKAQDISVLAIARRAEVGGTTLRKLLSGDSLKPDIQTAEKLAKALGVTRDELLHGRKVKGPESLEQLNSMMESYIEAEVRRRVADELARLRDRETTKKDLRHSLDLLHQEWMAGATEPLLVKPS